MVDSNQIELSYERIGDRLWSLFHASGYVASDALQFLPNGTISDLQSSKECYWRINDGVLCLLDANNVITARFDDVLCDAGRLVLKGREVSDPHMVLCLREKDQMLDTEDSPVNNACEFTKRSVQSFDIFDTLIARTVLDPTEVFDIVEKCGVANFKEIRIRSQALSNHTWSDIYKNYQRFTGIGDAEIAKVQELELRAEMGVCYLITETYNQVRNGDILVSDMYLPQQALSRLLRSVGFEKDVEIFVTPAGKASGSVWSTLKLRFEIEQHIGDNVSSDVEIPARLGIPSKQFSLSQFTRIEALLVSRGAPFSANLLKRFRLSNPLPAHSRERRLYEAQSLVNLPFLLLMAVHLREIMRRESLVRILFTTRDSCLLQPIFELLFPDVDSITFHCSRIAYLEPRPSFANYVREIYEPGKTLIFDLHGSFKSGRSLFEKEFGVLPRVHIFSEAAGRAPIYDGLSFDVSAGSNYVEALNVDQTSPVVTVSEARQPIRLPSTAEGFQIGAIYRAILAYFIEALRLNISSVREEVTALEQDIPWSELHKEMGEIVTRSPDILVSNLVEHESLTRIMNEERSDKGSTYACSHCYTHVYEVLLQKLDTRERLTMLEIGLNREGQDEIPSIRGWRRYLGDRLKIFGLDISPRFLRHHNPDAGIHILVGDQSNPLELAKCGLANPLGYDVIIDDGSHMSSHQQITFCTLWQFVRSGGVYVIEDLHYQPASEPIISTRNLFRAWRDKYPAFTPHVSPADEGRIMRDVESIEFYDSKSLLWGDSVRDALVVIHKRR